MKRWSSDNLVGGGRAENKGVSTQVLRKTREKTKLAGLISEGKDKLEQTPF